jgi:hypothetical protein
MSPANTGTLHWNVSGEYLLRDFLRQYAHKLRAITTFQILLNFRVGMHDMAVRKFGN